MYIPFKRQKQLLYLYGSLYGIRDFFLVFQMLILLGILFRSIPPVVGKRWMNGQPHEKPATIFISLNCPAAQETVDIDGQIERHGGLGDHSRGAVAGQAHNRL